GGHLEQGKEKIVAARKAALARALSDWQPSEIEQYCARMPDSYWLSLEERYQVNHARMLRAAEQKDDALAIDFQVDVFRDSTVVSIYTQDHPGLFARLSGAIAVSGGSIVDAKI